MPHHKLFDEILLDGFLLAIRPLLFHGHTLVLMIDLAGSSLAALAAHIGSTMATEQLGSQQIVHFCFYPCRGFLILLDLFLHPIKEVLGNNRRDAVGDHNVMVSVLSKVAAVLEDLRHAVDRVGIASTIQHIVLVQRIPDL